VEGKMAAQDHPKHHQKPENRCNQHCYHIEYINPNKTTKLHELRDICCRDASKSGGSFANHPILGLPGVTTPHDVNLNTVTISPDLYNQMADLSMIGMPETQEEDSNEDDEDKEPSDDDLVLPVTAFIGPIYWFADVADAMMDANKPVDPVGWQFQGRNGKWMCEDDNVELQCSALDYVMEAFPSNALNCILILTNKSL
jgi:hypothetical protein